MNSPGDARPWPLDHLHLSVRNVENSLEFYRSVLGFEAEDLGHAVCLRAPGRPCMICIDEGDLGGGDGHIYHLAILQPDRGASGLLSGGFSRAGTGWRAMQTT